MFNIMKTFALFACIALLSGCASFAKGVTEAILDPGGEEERVCRIEGEPFQGIKTLHGKATPKGVKSTQTLRMLIVHGIGDHPENYSEPFVANVARELDLPIRTRQQKRIHLSKAISSPTGTGSIPNKKLGTLLITRYTNLTGSQELLAFEVNWSDYNRGQRKAFVDSDKDVAKLRASVNDTVKTFFNQQVIDPVKYIGDSTASDIRAHIRQAACWMVSADWNEYPSEPRNKNKDWMFCSGADQKPPGLNIVRSGETSRNVEQIVLDDQFVAVTHSLGSRVFLDTFSISDEVLNSAEENVFSSLRDVFTEKKATVFMLSNQLPLLQLGVESRGQNIMIASANNGKTITSEYIPWDNTRRYSAHNPLSNFPKAKSKNDLCNRTQGLKPTRRFEELSLVTINDPNDLLSYKLTEDFKREYIDWALCPKFTDITIEVEPMRDVFGLSFASPGEAHRNYWTDEGLVQILVDGFDQDQYNQNGRIDKVYDIDDRGRNIRYDCKGTIYKDDPIPSDEATTS